GGSGERAYSSSSSRFTPISESPPVMLSGELASSSRKMAAIREVSGWVQVSVIVKNLSALPGVGGEEEESGPGLPIPSVHLVHAGAGAHLFRRLQVPRPTTGGSFFRRSRAPSGQRGKLAVRECRTTIRTR